MHPRSAIALLALLIAPVARAGHVVLSGDRYLELRGPDDTVDKPLSPLPFAASRDVVLTPAKDGFAVRATWRLEAPSPGWFDGLVAGPGVRVEKLTVDGADAPTTSGSDGVRLVVRADHPLVLVLDGFVDGDPDVGIDLALLPAVRGTVRVAGTARSLDVTSDSPALADATGWWIAGPAFHAVLVDPQPAAEKPPLWVGEVAIGVTVGDAEVTGEAHVEWHVRHGEIAEPSIRVANLGADVDVTGDDVRSWRREGDLLIIEPERSIHDRLAIDLKWTESVAQGAEARVALPTIAPTGAFRTTTTLQLAREDAIEVVPELGSSWEPIAATALPREAAGLVAGTPTATFQTGGAGGGTLSLLRFTPVEQPPVVVDIATVAIATNDEGRVLMRGYFTVRNERAAALRIVPPDGVDILGVQVSGSPVIPGRDDGPGWLIPLPRSTETVEGLLTFPIEVVAFGSGDAWDRKVRRDVPLFRLDAPIGVQRVTLHLPPGYESHAKVGEDGVVTDFTEGETVSYGLAVGDVAAAEVDTKFQEALSAYMENDFGGAQQKLDEIRALGGETDNVKKLQSNLDVVDVDETIGQAEAAEDTAMGRRVKDMARARAVGDEVELQETLQKAREAERSGDYESASSGYSQALSIGTKLAGLEQTETADQRSENATVTEHLKAVDKKAEEKEKSKDTAYKAKPSDASSYRSAAGKSANATTFEFDDLDIEGELVAPDGVAVADRDYDGTIDSADRVPLVALGDAPDDDGAFLQLGASGVVTDATTAPSELIAAIPPAGTDDIGFLSADPSYATGLADDGDGWGTITTTGTGSGGGAVGYGYGYGSIGGVVGGVVSGTLGGSAGPMPEAPPPAKAPSHRGARDASPASPGDYAVQTASAGSRGPRVSLGMAGHGRGGGGSGRAGSVAYGSGEYRDTGSDAPLPMASIGAEEPEEPVVTAASMSVVVPELGETVLFQSVLLPADAAPAVTARARITRHHP